MRGQRPVICRGHVICEIGEHGHALTPGFEPLARSLWCRQCNSFGETVGFDHMVCIRDMGLNAVCLEHQWQRLQHILRYQNTHHLHNSRLEPHNVFQNNGMLTTTSMQWHYCHAWRTCLQNLYFEYCLQCLQAKKPKSIFTTEDRHDSCMYLAESTADNGLLGTTWWKARVWKRTSFSTIRNICNGVPRHKSVPL